MAKGRAKILTSNPRAVPFRMRLEHDVEEVPAQPVAGADGWDDEDPPDETVLRFTTAELVRDIERVRSGGRLQLELDCHAQLKDRELREAVRKSLDRGVQVRIRVRDPAG